MCPLLLHNRRRTAGVLVATALGVSLAAASLGGCASSQSHVRTGNPGNPVDARVPIHQPDTGEARPPSAVTAAGALPAEQEPPAHAVLRSVHQVRLEPSSSTPTSEPTSVTHATHSDQHVPLHASQVSTWAQRVAAAVAHLPGGGDGAIVHPYANPDDDAWGVTSLQSCQVWISPRTPVSKLQSVVDHEYIHVLQCRAYDGDEQAEIAAAGSMQEIERIADAGAIQLGATWTWYTQNPTSREREAARNLLAGRRMF